MVSIISKGADNLNSFRSITPKRSDKSHSISMSTSFVKSENMETSFVNVLNNKSFKSSIPSSSVLSLVKNHSSNLNNKSTVNSSQLNLSNNHRNNIDNICYNNNNNNVINLNNQQQLPQRNDNINHHTKLVNNQKKRYSCDQCSYSTDRRDLYRRHENIHRDEKPFRCYVCNKMFNRADHVKKHFLRIHKGLEYNVKLIKRINGVDYTASNLTTNGSPMNNNNNSINNITSESTLLNNNNNICDNNNNNNTNSNNHHHNGAINFESQTSGIKSLPTFNLALWNEESNRLLFENFNSQSKYISSSRQSQSQSNSRLPQLSHQSTYQDREPLGVSNGQLNDQSDLLNIMNDAGLTLCLKLNGSNTEINGRTTNADKSPLVSCYTTKISSHVNSPRSTPPTPSPSPPFSDVRGINQYQGTISRNQENRHSPYDIRSVCAPQNHRKSTSLLSPINCKSLSPPQTIATSLVKPKCLNKNASSNQNGQHRHSNVSQPHQQMIITSLHNGKSKVGHFNNINNGCNIIEKVDEMIKMSENEFNRHIMQSMGSSSPSTLLTERDSFPHSTLIFNTEASNNTKKTNWFNRLNPVRVNTVSSVSTNNDESNDRSNSSNLQSTINIDMKYSHKFPDKDSDKYSEEEISSETWQSDEISINESDMIEDVDSEDDNFVEISEFKDEDDDKSDIYLHEIKSNTFDCEYCGCSFANYKSLHTHRYLLHQYMNKQNNLYPYSCVICGKRSSTQKQMINHMVNHNGLRNSRKHSSNLNGVSSQSILVMKPSIRKNRRKQSEPKRVAISVSNSNF